MGSNGALAKIGKWVNGLGPRRDVRDQDSREAAKRPIQGSCTSAQTTTAAPHRTPHQPEAVAAGPSPEHVESILLYQEGYPGLVDCPDCNKNRDFYFGQIPSSPHGDYIDAIHNKWWNNTGRLERHHGYIQWLFPNREEGLNPEAQPLQQHEIEAICDNPAACARFLKSYKMMLNFYGIRLVNQTTGEVTLATHWRTAFTNLNSNPHNLMRITRIIKCLGELGLERYQAPLVGLLLDQAFRERRLSAACRKSCGDFWIYLVKDSESRQHFQSLIMDKLYLPEDDVSSHRRKTER